MDETPPAFATPLRQGSAGREAMAGVPPASPDVPASAPPGADADTRPAAPTDTAVHHTPQLIVEIPLSRMERNPKQPRVEFAEPELEELAASIRVHGVLQPLLVVRKPLEPGEPERFELVAGERRWRAAQRAGLATVPCVVHDDLTERERLEISLVENLQRKDLNPIEEANAYRRLNVEFGLTHEEIARRVGKSRPSVSNTIRLLDLPPSMQESLTKGEITFGAARALLAVADPVQRQLIFEKVQRGEVSARELERMQRGRKPRRRSPKPGDPEILHLERALSVALGAPVRIKPVGAGGVIEVDYFSSEELSGIVGRIAEEGG